MKQSEKQLATIAGLRTLSMPAAKEYAQYIQSLCVKAPSLACIAKACMELGQSQDYTAVALRASEIHGSTRDNVKSLSHSLSRTPSSRRKSVEARALTSGELAELRSIAQFCDMSISRAGEYVRRIQQLCVKQPSYAAVAKACQRFVGSPHTDMDIAVQASEIEGRTRENVRTQSDTSEQEIISNPHLVDSAYGNSVIGLKAIRRQYGEKHEEGISKFGDWESD